MIFLTGKFERDNMRKIKMLLVVCVLSLFCGLAYGEDLIFTGTWVHESDTSPETIEFTEDEDSLNFSDYNSTIDMDTGMVIIYFNNKHLVIIDEGDHDDPEGTVYMLSRTLAAVDDISGIWRTSVDNIDDMTLTLFPEDNTYTLIFNDDPEDPDEEEDDSPSSLCFIGALR